MEPTKLKFIGFNEEFNLLEFITPNGDKIYSNNIENYMEEKPRSVKWRNYVHSHSTVTFDIDNGKEGSQIDTVDLNKSSDID